MVRAEIAQCVVLVQQHWSAISTRPHHPCLGPGGVLPYSAVRGKKSVTREALDDLKRQIPVWDYLQDHDWRPVRQLSRGRWLGLCPLHQDHHPSFVVDASKGLFYCYGCGRGGDIIRFAEIITRRGSRRQWRCFANGVASRRYCRMPRTSIGFSYTDTARRSSIFINAESARRKSSITCE